jgi:hypothetical protein
LELLQGGADPAPDGMGMDSREEQIQRNHPCLGSGSGGFEGAADARFGERRRRRWTFHPRDLVAQPSIRGRCGVAGLPAVLVCVLAAGTAGVAGAGSRGTAAARTAAGNAGTGRGIERAELARRICRTGGEADLRAAAAGAWGGRTKILCTPTLVTYRVVEIF